MPRSVPTPAFPAAQRVVLAVAVLPALLLAAGPGTAAGQIRGSELGSVSQTIDGTTVTVEYSRPSARGRALFGDLVPYGAPWTGANWATKLSADRDIRLNGATVPAGEYSVWLIPRADEWTLVLDPRVRLFHIQKPDSTADQIRTAVTPEEAPHVEMLTWSFPAVSGDGATLRMQWGTTALPLPIVVQPTRPVALTADERSLYVGSYEMSFPEGIGWPTPATFEVFEEDGMLRGRLPFSLHPGDELDFDLIPAGTHRFSPGLYRDGELFNVEMGGTFEFDVDGREPAASVLLRGIEGSVFGEGERSGG